MERAKYLEAYEDGDYSSETTSPGLRYFEKYRKYLKGRIIDFGAGRGLVVQKMLTEGYDAYGVDIIGERQSIFTSGSLVVYGDIGKELLLTGFNTATCFDVLEHLDESELEQAIKNLSQAERQILTIYTHSHIHNGVELHKTIKPDTWWRELLEQFLDVKEKIQLEGHRFLFICESRQ